MNTSTSLNSEETHLDTSVSEAITPDIETPFNTDAQIESTSDTPLADAAVELTDIEASESALDAVAAIVPDSTADQIVNLLEIGGPVVWVLTVFSIFALSLIFLKFWQLSISNLGAKRKTLKAIDAWNRGKTSEAIDALNYSSQSLPKMIGVAMRGMKSQGDTPKLREELGRLASMEMESLRSYLRPLEVIANLSPLLGLLGTVLGMIVAFQQMEMAGNQVDPSVLSGGIWQALLTTAAGLTVAIPVFMAHSILERKTERIGHDMENLMTCVFTRNCLDESCACNIPETVKETEETWDKSGAAIHAA